jgi:hypothetical protein
LQEDLASNCVVFNVCLRCRGRIDLYFEPIQTLLLLDSVENWVYRSGETSQRRFTVGFEYESVRNGPDLSPDLDEQASDVDTIERTLCGL